MKREGGAEKVAEEEEKNEEEGGDEEKEKENKGETEVKAKKGGMVWELKFWIVLVLIFSIFLRNFLTWILFRYVREKIRK